jgi:hypothetical protein
MSNGLSNAATFSPKRQMTNEKIIMKAIAVTGQAAGTAGMKLVELPEPQAAINDVVVGAIEGAREIASSQIDVASHLETAMTLEAEPIR